MQDVQQTSSKINKIDPHLETIVKLLKAEQEKILKAVKEKGFII